MLVCYPQPGKAKSKAVLDAFAAGAPGAVVRADAVVLDPGAVAFYGVVGLEHLLRLAWTERRDFYYGDNAFFDVARQRFFRFARGAMQLHRLAPPDHDRARALDLKVKPWQAGGRHIVVVEQSDHFLKLSGAGGAWMARTVATLQQHTDRPLKLRPWRRDKDKAAKTLHADLKGAWALVTHMSAAANEALLAGVPVFVSGKCAALPLASGELDRIESPARPDGREDWAAGLAGMQWTVEELRAGMAWRALCS